MKRIVLSGEGLTGFASIGVGDEYLRVLFPRAGETEPELPVVVDTRSTIRRSTSTSDRPEEEIEDDYDKRLAQLGL